MGEAEMSELADRILRDIPFDRDCPVYSDHNFERKLRRNHLQERRLVRRDVALDRECGHLVSRQVDDAVRSASLSARQAAIFRARLRGETFESIAAGYGVSKQAICKTFEGARTKVRACWDQNPFRGLHQIYSSEVRRARKGKCLRRHDD